MERHLRSTTYARSPRCSMHFDFSSFYLNESLSDVTLLLRVDGDVKQRLPGHGVVLANVSRVFKDEIEQQQGAGGGRAATIPLDVSPNQVPAACALVRYVYTGALPEPSANQQLLLVHMLHLAQQFGVSDCQAACHDVLLQCNALQPPALGLAFQLLSAPQHTTAGSFKPLLDHCLDQLQQQLGDMEAVLQCPEQLSQLHSLPLPALLALLLDDRTAAASENTVLAAVHSWMAAAAQRDVRVDAAQREQLAAAVRVPLLEPCYLATVLPRMGWLLETLGPHGLAAAAGVARGLCDAHAEPVLGCARACGALAAGWLKGPRPVPPSCSRAMHGGPALSLDWDLPLSDIKAAFEAACADAAAKALSEQQQREARAAAAAAARQAALVSTEAPGWGWSPIAPGSAAAAVSAVASVAAAAAARVFNKRKRDMAAACTESCDEGGRDQQSCSKGRSMQQQQQHQFGADEGDEEEEQPAPTQQRGGTQQPAASDATEETAGGYLPQHTRKRRRRDVGPSSQAVAAAAAAAAAGGTTPNKQAAAGSNRQRPGRAPAAALQPQQPLSPQAGGAGDAAAAPDAGFFSQDPAAAAGGGAGGLLALPGAERGGSISSGTTQPGLRQLKLRSPEMQFAGYHWRLVLYFQPCAAAGISSSGGDGAAGAVADHTDGAPPAAGAAGRRGGGRQAAVAAAHAVGLPDDAAHPTVGAVSSCTWTARLAVEARPAAGLQHGVSTAAFSGSLAIRMGGGQHNTSAAAAAAPQNGARGRRGGRSKATAAASPARTCVAHDDVGPSPSRRLNSRAVGDSPARYNTGAEAAAAAAAAGAAGTSSRQQRGGRGGVHDGLMSIPESDVDDGGGKGWQEQDSVSEDEEEEESGSLSGSSSDEEGRTQQQQQRKRGGNGRDVAAQDSDDDFLMVGEFPAGTTPRSSGRRHQRQQQQQQQRGGGSAAAARRPASAGGEEGGDLPLVTPGVPPAPAPRSHVSTQGGAEEGEWRVFHLPQGSWVKSRACDTGFTNFLSISMQQGVWDEAAWQAYMQPGQTLQLRGNIWNVR